MNTKSENVYYTVSDIPRPDGHQSHVAAPSGYARRPDGTIYRDGTDPRKSGPEMTRDSFAAYKFMSYPAARRQATKLGINNWIITCN